MSTVPEDIVTPMMSKRKHWNSSDETWRQAVAHWIFVCPYEVTNWRDLDVCVTYFAKNLERDPFDPWNFVRLFPCNLPQGATDRAAFHSVQNAWAKSMCAFACTIPLAILARRAGRPLLFKPVNGLQRALVWATVYFGAGERVQHWAYLARLEHPAAIAGAFFQYRKPV
ncbi:hypothetical protein BN946_scf184803.g2 [Trametes cinnabarina]|uniref:Uncharacterized protein n=1 Tax=Pycnoporus cinnabarinus TaxID=5643 RepID=A0A060SC26_PYCCI|nr:hypothetical protein BN946_scf184803.g2 [Trametes cinnabarina]